MQIDSSSQQAQLYTHPIRQWAIGLYSLSTLCGHSSSLESLTNVLWLWVLKNEIKESCITLKQAPCCPLCTGWCSHQTYAVEGRSCPEACSLNGLNEGWWWCDYEKCCLFTCWSCFFLSLCRRASTGSQLRLALDQMWHEVFTHSFNHQWSVSQKSLQVTETDYSDTQWVRPC